MTTEQVRLAPLMSPRPGAGQFYLQHTSKAPASGEEQLPAAYWGAERHEDPEHERYRPVRGRKVYWHGDPEVQRPPRHLAREQQQNEAVTPERQLVPKGTVFRQQITFDNISPAEFGSLLLTLRPGLLRLPGEPSDVTYALRLAGGKPLGLGSCAVEVTELEWWGAQDRYGGGQPDRPSTEDFFAAARDQVVELAEAAQRHWPTLRRVLRVDAVDPALIWYPLGGDWGDETYRDRSFQFFAHTNGRFLKQATKDKKKREPIVALPDPEPGNDQRLSSIDRKR